jgi:flagellum-specific ATP synthase
MDIIDKHQETFAPDLTRYFQKLPHITTIKQHGRVTKIVGLIIESEGPAVMLGELCYIVNPAGGEVRSEVVGFKGNIVQLMPLGELGGISPGSEVRASGKPLMVKVGWNLLGRVLDGLGEPIDGLGPLDCDEEYPIYNSPPNPFLRPRIEEQMEMGIRVLDSCLTFGKGQRVGIFAGSGVGKSTTLSMVARFAKADINILALIGERGRELRDFLERDLGPEGMKRSVVTVATSDTPALVRLKASYTGTAVAEYFRDTGNNVMLMMDSVTRFAMAQREVGLAVGEPPATKGYTPSCFALLPKLMERAGTSPKGTITAIYTVLVDGDDMSEPIADCVRGILDGHIVLSRKIAHRNIYPAVDVLASVSRVFTEVTTDEHKALAGKLREVLDMYKQNEDLINIGAYQRGANPKVDYAIAKIDDVQDFLKQGIFERNTFAQMLEHLRSIFPDVARGF